MGCDKLILDNEFHHKVAMFHVQRVCAELLRIETISEQDVNEIRYSRTMAEANVSIVKSIHVDGVGEHSEPQMAIS